MYKVRYRPLPPDRVSLDPVLIRAVPSRHAIYAYVDMSQLDPALIPSLETIGEGTTSIYDWRPDGPAADPAVELRVHRVRQVPGSGLAMVEIAPGVIHLSVDRDLMKADLAERLGAHATQFMRLMQ
ncbi:hypothetical protein [Streptosporangium sp. NPDC004631]